MTARPIKTAAPGLSITTPSRALPDRRLVGRVLVGGALATTVILYGPQMSRIIAGARPHGPDLALFAAQPMVIQLHVLAAVAAIALGGLIFAMRKGRAFHRTVGWIWVTLMLATAVSSLFIVGLNGDVWSFIHLLSGWTLIVLPLGMWAARKGRVASHRKTMTGLYLGVSTVAAAFAFLPGRLMWNLFLG